MLKEIVGTASLVIPARRRPRKKATLPSPLIVFRITSGAAASISATTPSKSTASSGRNDSPTSWPPSRSIWSLITAPAARGKT